MPTGGVLCELSSKKVAVAQCVGHDADQFVEMISWRNIVQYKITTKNRDVEIVMGQKLISCFTKSMTIVTKSCPV